MSSGTHWEAPSRCGYPHTHVRPALLRDLVRCFAVKAPGHPKTAGLRPSALCLGVSSPLRKLGENG